MGSLLSKTDKRALNYEIPWEVQSAAARKIKRAGAKVVHEPHTELWHVEHEVSPGKRVYEILTPRTLVNRAERNHYGVKEETKPESADGRSVQVPSRKGRSSRPVAPERKQRAGKVDSSSDKRLDKQRGTGSDGKGSGKASSGRGAGNKKVSRKKTSSVRKYGSSIPAAKADNGSRKTRVGQASKPGVNRKKPSRTKRRG